MYQKYLKDVCLDKYQTIWTITCQNILADLEYYSTQNCLLYMLGKWKRAVDNG